jgi:DDE domain
VVYLYRAADSTGATIDFLLSAIRDIAAAKRFLAKALGGKSHPHPSGHQHRQGRRLPARHRGTQSPVRSIPKISVFKSSAPNSCSFEKIC